MLSVIEQIRGGQHLTRGEAESAMEEVLSGRASELHIADFLAALREKGETEDELVGFATVMRRHACPIFANGAPSGWRLVDTCGTGGDGSGTFNVSTCAAIVVAGAGPARIGAGARVAKHGNRSISSRCGSADVLEALGVNLLTPPERVAECIEKIGIGFLFAPALHTAMKHAMPARRRLGGRTVFNLLGPLTNPAGARVQVVGVFAADRVALIAGALAKLGAERALVVHGADGLDEISLSGETQIADVREGAVRRYTVTSEDFGLPRAAIRDLAGGEAAENAAIIRRVLDGEPGARRNIVLANAAAALVAAGAAGDFREATRLAAESVDTGGARQKLKALVEFTNP